ncbi:hypothetical protein [Evansella clarkii]|uniref:hypothetical protein n=1 Tax=Evansella clarkii TaxID=79879 RepID=UPI001F32147D|nr:hypothetical protein [Evansella clarkii]
MGNDNKHAKNVKHRICDTLLVTLPFLGTKNIKRFLHASIIIIIFEIINVITGKKRNWWLFYNNPNSYFAN